MNSEMNCEQVRPVLLDYVMDEVPAGERRSIELHLQHCGVCAREMAEAKETVSLVAHAEVTEEIPRKIRIVAEPERAWAAFWRNPARLAFAGAGLLSVAIAFLSLFHTTVSYQNGNFQLAFGAPAVISGAPLSGKGPAQVTPASAITEGPFDRAEVARMIAAAVAASQAEQQKQSGAAVQQVAQRIEQQWRRDLGDIPESLRYFQAQQNLLWKGQVQNQQLVSSLMQRTGTSSPVQQ